MSHKFSITGMILSSLGIVVSGLTLHHWSMDDGLNPILASYYAKFTALFFYSTEHELSVTSNGFSITEEIAIYITMAIAIIFAITSIVLSFFSLRNCENITFSIASLLLGNTIFILYSLKLSFITLALSGGYAVYIKSRINNQAHLKPKMDTYP